MSRDQTQSIPTLTAADFEAVLEDREAEPGLMKAGAFNRAEFAKNLVKFAPIALSLLAAAGVPIPAQAAAIAKLVIEAADSMINGVNPAA